MNQWSRMVMGFALKSTRNTNGQYISSGEHCKRISSLILNNVCRLVKFSISSVVLSFQVLYFVFSVINKSFSSSNFNFKFQFHVMQISY